MTSKKPPGENGRAGASTERRDELVAIAAGLFATRGYAQTTVRDIADEAGILSGSLYHHFSSKEAMLEEILRGFLGELVERFATIAAEAASPQEALTALVRHSFATIHATPHAVALYQNESGVLLGQPGFEFVDKTSRDVESIWQEVLVAGQESGVFRADLEPGLVYRFVRDGLWSSVRWYQPGGKLQHESVADQYLDLLHGGLLSR
jgi:AcrR family transcriptional regulator